MARSCPHLQKVELTKCDVEEASVLALAVHCKQLQEIYIVRCRVSVETGEQILLYCRRLTDLHIHVYTHPMYFWNQYNSKEIRAIRAKCIEIDRDSTGAEAITQCSSNICLIL